MRKCKAIALFLCLLMLLPMAALCDDEPAVLTIVYRDGNTAIHDVEFSLYRVADMDDNGKFTLTKAFSKYNVNANMLLEDSSRMAATLEGFVLRDQLAPQHTLTVNQTGAVSLSWPMSSFEPGMFLITSTVHRQNGIVYKTPPVLFSLPFAFSEEEWSYQLDIHVKAQKEYDVPKPPLRQLRVVKRWENNGHDLEQPKKVIVDLLQNGVIADTQELSAENDWMYTWKNLDGNSSWTVTEQEVNGYRVSIERMGDAFVVRNTYDKQVVIPTPTPSASPSTSPSVTPSASPSTSPSTSPSVTPSASPSTSPSTSPGVTPSASPSTSPSTSPGVTPSASPSTSPSTSPGTTPSASPSISPTVSPSATPSPVPTSTPRPTKPPRPRPTKNPHVLPQTGQIWWPVPALMVSGSALILVGLIRRRGDDDED